MYASPYNTERPYTGPLDTPERCPICGALGDCDDAAAVPMPYPPFGSATDVGVVGGPLRRYVVTDGENTTVMQLNESDAARYDTAAVLSEVT